MKRVGFAIVSLMLGCSKTAEPPAAPPPPALPSAQKNLPPGQSFGALPGSKEQSLDDAWAAFCDAQSVAGELTNIPKSEQATRLAAFLHERVRNQAFILFIAESMSMTPAQRRAHYLEELAKVHRTQCALGEIFFPPAAPSDAGVARDGG